MGDGPAKLGRSDVGPVVWWRHGPEAKRRMPPGSASALGEPLLRRPGSATSSACATCPAMSACTWNTSVSAASNGCCHRVRGALPGRDLTSSGLTCTRLAPSGSLSQRTVPVSRYSTPELARDLAAGFVVVPVLHRAAARDHLELRQRGELAAHRVGDAVGEVGVGRVAQVLEREHGQPRGRPPSAAAPRRVRRQANSTPRPMRMPDARAPAAATGTCGAGPATPARGALGAAPAGRPASAAGALPARDAGRRRLQRLAELRHRREPVGRAPAPAPAGSPGPRSPARWAAPPHARRRLGEAPHDHRLRRRAR